MTSFTFENAITVIGLLCMGGILGTYLRILWERQNKAQLEKQEYKQKRYLSLIILRG